MKIKTVSGVDVHLNEENGQFSADYEGESFMFSTLDLITDKIIKVTSPNRPKRPTVKVPVLQFINGEIRLTHYVGVHTQGANSRNEWARGGETDSVSSYSRTFIPASADPTKVRALIDACAALQQARRAVEAAEKAVPLVPPPTGSATHGRYGVSLEDRIKWQDEYVNMLVPFAPFQGWEDLKPKLP